MGIKLPHSVISQHVLCRQAWPEGPWTLGTIRDAVSRHALPKWLARAWAIAARMSEASA